MNKKLFLGALLSLMLVQPAAAQFNWQEIDFWVGSGSDSSLLVIDFAGSDFDSSYAWGYRHNGAKTGEDMLLDIAAADVNLSINVAGGFLNDVIYHRHAGIGGQPDYWSTWSGIDTASLITNMGISTPLVNGEWFGLSYTDFAPALKPGLPIPAFKASDFTLTEVTNWYGTGNDSAAFIVDFLNGNSYVWGYLFNDSIAASSMLSDIGSQDGNLTINASSFLIDIIYQSDSGLGGQPNYWGTWSATNLGNWAMNIGISQSVKPGDLFGASYTDFNPAVRPNAPKNNTGLSINRASLVSVEIYPNPAADWLMVKGLETEANFNIINARGQDVFSGKLSQSNNNIQISHLESGFYLLQLGETQMSFIKK
jgi:hypothetical protein